MGARSGARLSSRFDFVIVIDSKESKKEVREVDVGRCWSSFLACVGARPSLQAMHWIPPSSFLIASLLGVSFSSRYLSLAIPPLQIHEDRFHDVIK